MEYSMSQCFVCVFLFLSTIILIKKWLTSLLSPHKSLPPSPPRLPILGNLHQVGEYSHRALHKLAQRYGPLMLLHFGSKPVLVASSADMAREIMKTHDIIFSNRARSLMGSILLYDGKDIAAASYGEYWRQMRSLCVLQLLSDRRVKSFQAVRVEEVELLVKKIDASCLLSLAVNLSEMFSHLTNDVICRVAFGKKYREEGEIGRKFKYLTQEFMKLLENPGVGEHIPWLSWVNRVNGLNDRAKKVAREYDAFLDGIVEEHLKRMVINGEEEEDRKDDLVDIMLQHQKDNSIGFTIHRDNIKAIILDIFSGGTDTTYTVLEWLMAELLRNPTFMKELQNEVRGVTKGRPQVTEDDLEEMHYLRAVIKETLRLYPPVPIALARESRQYVKINGHDIAAGTMVLVNSWAVARDPKSWPEPEKFNPERFLSNPIDFRGHDFELIPFGAGRRGCPGISFAMAVIELAVANIVNRFDWRLPDGVKADELDMSECLGLTIHRKVPLVAVATPYPHRPLKA